MLKVKKIEEVKMKIIQQLIVEWTCPECQKKNTEGYYNAPGRTRLICQHCGILCIGSR